MILNALKSRLCLPRTGIRDYHILMFGTDEVSLPTFKKLHELHANGSHLVEKLTLVCPDSGRDSGGNEMRRIDVLKYAKQHHIDHITVPIGVRKLDEWSGADSIPDADIAVVVSFGYFLTPNVLKHAKKGAINMHPSLLPKYRGASPVPYAILNGDSTSGISIINIHPTAFDAGEILLQEEYPLDESETIETILPRFASLGATAVETVLNDYDNYVKNAKPQSTKNITRAPKLYTEQGLVNFTSESVKRDPKSPLEPYESIGEKSLSQVWTCDTFINAYRAFADSFGVWFYVEHDLPDGSFKYVRTRVTEAKRLPKNNLPEEWRGSKDADVQVGTVEPGSFYFDPGSKRLALALSDGYVEITRIQPEYKNSMDALSFVNGIKFKKLCHHARAVSFKIILPEVITPEVEPPKEDPAPPETILKVDV